MNTDNCVKTNKEYWNERVRLHRDSEFYGLDSLKKGVNMLHELEIYELGDIRGKKLLHLQCHFGMDSLSLEMLGAVVTGVDFSEEAIKSAEDIRDELGMKAKFILSDISNLCSVLNEKFDIVYTSYGVLTWLPDIEAWGQTVSHFLNDDGFFYIAEILPSSLMFENSSPAESPQIAYPYFNTGMPIRFDEAGSYAIRDSSTSHNTTYEFTHSLSDIIMSLINAGLKIDFFHEHPFTVWKHFPDMEKKGRYYTWKHNIPLLFSLKASKAGK